MKRYLILGIICSNVLLAAGGSSKKLSITGLAGFPHPVNIGLDYRLGAKFSMGVTGGYFSLNRKWGDEDTYKFVTQNVEGRLRYHPYGGAFFFGIAGGQQTVTADLLRSITTSGITVDVLGSGQITNPYVAPHLGWFLVTGKGFTIGFEAGLYVPFSAKTSVTLTSDNPLVALVTTTTEYVNLLNAATKVANAIGSQALPFVTVLRLGWSF